MNIKFGITVRDLTNDTDFALILPMEESELVKKLNRNHEYIIITHNGMLDCGEYTNIEELNMFLLDCKDNGVEKETLGILSKVCSDWKDVRTLVETESYTIFDTSEIDEWAINGEEAYGRYMYDLGFNTFGCDIPEELEDYINWDQNWFTLESVGWSTVRYNGNEYIVHR